MLAGRPRERLGPSTTLRVVPLPLRGRIWRAGPTRPMTVRLTTTPFDPGALLAEFSAGRDETGAVVTFTGIARASGGEVARLELEAYPGFTDAEIERIAGATKARF